MATYKSQFKTLPKASELRALAGLIPFLEDLPFIHLRAKDQERRYLNAVYRCLNHGVAKSSRPGQNTLMLDDVQYSIDISNGVIPLPTTRYVAYRLFVVETIWFLSGSTDVKFLKDNNVNIWDNWVIPGTEVFEKAEKHTPQEFQNLLRLRYATQYQQWLDYQAKNNIGRPTMEELECFLKDVLKAVITDYQPVKLVSGSIGKGAYGAQWRNWKDSQVVPFSEAVEKTYNEGYQRVGTVNSEHVLISKMFDQVADAVRLLRESPDSRRIMVSAWNPPRVPDCALPPCHMLYQFISHVNDSGVRELTIKLTLRSSDALIGAPANIMQYALLAHMVAHVTNHKATKLVFSPGDFHIYEDQIPFVVEQLSRVPKEDVLATVSFNKDIKEIDQFTMDDIVISGYSKEQVHPNILYPVAV